MSVMVVLVAQVSGMDILERVAGGQELSYIRSGESG